MYGWNRYRSGPRGRSAPHAAKVGKGASPVVITGRTIATSFWGKAWCGAMESYGDYENRLPRGRTYVRNGSVVDLRIEAGRVSASVSGSRLYTTTVRVKPLSPAGWRAVVDTHAAQVSSLVDLLQGKLPASLLRALSDRSSGLFPGPTEIEFECSCPDWASMCKHVAAVLYGVGARLDQDPGLFFLLRGVEVSDLAARGAAVGFTSVGADDLVGADLGDIFGIDLGGAASPLAVASAAPAAPAAPARKAPAATARNAPAAPAAVALEPVAAPAARARKAPAAPARKPAAASSAPASSAPAAPARKAPAATKHTGRKPVAQACLISDADLGRLGVDPGTVAQWVASGVLLPTGQPGIYAITSETGPRIVEHRALRRGAPA